MLDLTERILKYPRTTIALAVLITALLGWNIPSIQFDPDIKAMIPQDFAAVQNLNRLDEIFGGSEIVVVAVESDSLLSPTTLNRFAELAEDLADVPGVDRVLSLYSAKEISGSSEAISIGNVLADMPETSEQVAELMDRIRSNDLVYGNIVSEDFRTMAFFLMLGATTDIDDFALRGEILNLISGYGSQDEIYVAGLPFTRASMVETMQRDLRSFLPYGILLMIVLLAFSFRSWIGVFLPLAVVIMSIVWTVGLMALLKMKFVFITVLIPVMLIAIANDYGIHIIAHYFENFKRKLFSDRAENILETTSSLKAPIFLAGMTTIIGFMSLLGHLLPPARQVGLLAGFGIMVAFVLSLTFLPAALQVLRIPPWIAAGGQDKALNRLLIKWGSFFTHYRIPFLLVSALLIVLAALRIPTLTIDTDPIHYYREDSEIRANNERISDHFGGSTQLSVVVKGDAKDPATLRKMKDISEFLERRPSVTRTLSIVDQVEKMNEAWNDGDTAYRVIPEDRAIVATFVEQLSWDAEGEIERLVDIWGDPPYREEFQTAQVLARINRISSAEVLKIMRDTDQYIQQHYGREEVSEVTGTASMIGVLTDMIARGQLRSLALSIVLVFLVTALVFRSIQAGFYCIVPLSGAVILVFGLMSYLHIELNVATSMLTSILIGVGIDYTIHFLWHYRQHVRRGKSAEEAVIETLTTSGKGIIFNALSVMVGFVVLTLSGFLPIYFFGFVIIFSIGMCLFGALAVLPALVVWTKPRFLFGDATDEA